LPIARQKTASLQALVGTLWSAPALRDCTHYLSGAAPIRRVRLSQGQNSGAEDWSNLYSGVSVALILLIDDDGFYRGLIRQILEEAGHQVLEAQDGEEGLKRFRAQHPDLVITDMRMPGFDGGEVIRRLKAISNDVRIVAISGAATFYHVDYF